LTRARQLGNTARCLAVLERDMDQARAMYAEARKVTAEADARLLAVEWAGAILSAFGGNDAGAVKEFEQVLGLARAEGERWAEYECLRALVELEIEAKVMPARKSHVAELVEVAAKMGEGSSVSVARALESLLSLRHGDPDAGGAVDRALAMLRDVDAKGMLAYTLTIAAEADIDEKRFDQAEKRAEEALACASAVGRRTQTALARVLLARAALGRGDAGLGRSHFDRALRDLDEAFAVSARARAAVLRLGLEFEH